MARKVVGVGSVGTRAWIVLLEGRDAEDALVLQAKEAVSSVLEPFVGESALPSHGERVVHGQRLMQAASDIFLGWTRAEGLDRKFHDFYVRQLWDWKASGDLLGMTERAFPAYCRACAWTLARAHARTGDRFAITAYLGSGPSFDKAIARFASAYAEQNELDHAALAEADASGRIAVEHGSNPVPELRCAVVRGWARRSRGRGGPAVRRRPESIASASRDLRIGRVGAGAVTSATGSTWGIDSAGVAPSFAQNPTA